MSYFLYFKKFTKNIKLTLNIIVQDIIYIINFSNDVTSVLKLIVERNHFANIGRAKNFAK